MHKKGIVNSSRNSSFEFRIVKMIFLNLENTSAAMSFCISISRSSETRHLQGFLFLFLLGHVFRRGFANCVLCSCSCTSQTSKHDLKEQFLVFHTPHFTCEDRYSYKRMRFLVPVSVWKPFLSVRR
jgi:hypothetical protein